MKVFIAAVALLYWLGVSSPAQSHSPYFGESEKIEHPELGVIEFAVLYGDGIFFADPSQVVVFDSEGYLLAATPQSVALLIHCDGSVSPPQCRIFDELRGVVLEPDYEKLARSRVIEEDGRPSESAYPEYMDIEYGFTERPATVYEKLRFEVLGVWRSPVGSVLSVLWWALAWSLLARLAWKLKRNGWSLTPFRWPSVALGVLSLVIFIGMSFFAAYGWLLTPYSLNFFLFAFISGAVIAAILTRPKAVVQRD